ncbi:MAG: family 20 glycosylhydrolase [Tessaracoccus sp.]
MAHRTLPRKDGNPTPAVPERGFHLDAARKFFPSMWIHELLERMAQLEFNAFQWHFSENEGVRLESLAFPEIVSEQFITRDEAREIIAHAAELGIAVVPSLDMPGHLRQALGTRPQLRLPEGLGGADTRHALDITASAGRDFAKRLIDDYADLFGDSTHWNLGGDEFVDFGRIDDYPALSEEAHRRFGPAATGFDLLTDFVNEIAEHLVGLGFVLRAWNDGLLRSEFVTLDHRIEIAWWTNWHAGMTPLADALEAGHRVLNFHDSQWYYVVGETSYLHPTAERAWATDWHPGLFPRLTDRSPQLLPKPYPEHLLGAYFSVWCDAPDDETVEEIAERIALPMAAFAERCWNGGSDLTYPEFVALASEVSPASGACA